ncbi:MAG: M48 family metalloprotease [Bacteroidetes bacterium]|nr:M48 family metalloprotease [Bacteroidota bacterium]
MLRKYFGVLFAAIILSLYGCGGQGGKGLNLFSIEDEIALGKQVKQEIESNPQDYPILPEAGNQQIYSYIRGLGDRLLKTGQVAYRNDFAWEIKIIDDDQTLNAFCTPGGYIYVYTGLIKFLDAEDELMGVLGHEIAHAALRHSTRQLTKLYGIQVLTSVITGNSDPGMIEQIALALVSLKFSRGHETEADQYSVIYMCGTDMNAAGAAGFFEKMEDQPSPPEFLSTHPNPGNRVLEIKEDKVEYGCSGSKTNQTTYQKMKALL